MSQNCCCCWSKKTLGLAMLALLALAAAALIV